ncbi:L,D-transpeptidase catalytic domain [Flexibacter flexilis DSM 6793]|uniref:L,D-transpeptidase catalytic domain n=1 Tax=Flexibacter flexilis DSM 6793 TaxID=927664 RepID=A0A1I1G937_9BACT|nr:L,D-transpeptidase family protein [Flexibacter flexilis]SFC06348.1 L,D-transpeptidase catalytic domain [Flexibacter flexilis DSM 6793]
MKLSTVLVVVLLVGLSGYYFYPEKKLPKTASVDSLVVYKSQHKLLVFAGQQPMKTYIVSFGANPVGKKTFEGDERTPEGLYFINDKNPKSGYHKNLGISYPNKADTKNARKQNKRAGGQVKIHGLRNGLGFVGKFQRWYNWTNGCIAVTDAEMDELYESVRVGTPIRIKP